MRRIFFIAFIIALCNTTNHLSAQTAKYSNEFLSIGIGARSLAMSNAGIASTNDATAGYWNPAGLTTMSHNYEIAAMHSEYFAGIAQFDYLGGAYSPDTLNSFGISILRFGVDDILNTLEIMDSDGNIDYNKIKKFSYADYAFLFSYAKVSKIKGLRYGATAKIVHRRPGDFARAYGFGLDAGIQYQTGKWQFGAVGRDITSTFNAWTFDEDALNAANAPDSLQNEMPDNALEITVPRLLLGVGRHFMLSQKIDAYIEADMDISFDKTRHVLIEGDPISIDPHVGVEIDYSDIIFVRFGVGNFQRVPDFEENETFTFQPNLGLGFKIRNFTLDYALTDIGDQSIAQYSNVFSLKFSFSRFGKK